jgi:hypothetical protein
MADEKQQGNCQYHFKGPQDYLHHHKGEKGHRHGQLHYVANYLGVQKILKLVNAHQKPKGMKDEDEEE